MTPPVEIGTVLGIGHLTRPRLGQIAGDVCTATGLRESTVCERIALEVCRQMRSRGYACWVSPLELPAYVERLPRTPNFADVLAALNEWQRRAGFSEVRYVELHACGEPVCETAPELLPEAKHSRGEAEARRGTPEAKLSLHPTPGAQALTLAAQILTRSHACPAHPLGLGELHARSRLNLPCRHTLVEMQLGAVGEVARHGSAWERWLTDALTASAG